MSALERAITTAGGITALANAIKVTPQVVVNWRKRGVPTERVRAIVQATNGEVSAHDLAPDLFPEGFEFPPESAPIERVA